MSALPSSAPRARAEGETPFDSHLPFGRVARSPFRGDALQPPPRHSGVAQQGPESKSATAPRSCADSGSGLRASGVLLRMRARLRRPGMTRWVSDRRASRRRRTFRSVGPQGSRGRCCPDGNPARPAFRLKGSVIRASIGLVSGLLTFSCKTSFLSLSGSDKQFLVDHGSVKIKILSCSLLTN
jgi:hypothetical protein